MDEHSGEEYYEDSESIEEYDDYGGGDAEAELDAEQIAKEKDDDENDELVDEYDDSSEDIDFVDLKTVSQYNKEIIVVKPENRITSHKMSKYEMTEHVSIRATQISQFNDCLVDVTGLFDPISMAKRELMMRMSPLILRRHIGQRVSDGEKSDVYEYWSPNEMEFSTAYNDAVLKK